MESRLRLVSHGKQLWTRELARKIRVKLATLLDEAPAGGVVILDTEGVEVFDYSFANELFGKSQMSLSGEFPGRFLVVEHLTSYTSENLGKALESLNLAMIVRKGTRLELLGKVHPADEETFRSVARARKPITAAELKDQLGINLTAMNERLSKLTGLGLVRRTKGSSAAGREQYEYTVLK